MAEKYSITFNTEAYERGAELRVYADDYMFRQDSGRLHVSIDGRNNADSWSMIDDRDAEGFEEECPGMLAAVRQAFEDGPPRPAKGKREPTPHARVAKEVRRWLGFRGADDKGNRVYAHAASKDGRHPATVVYESKDWAWDFCDYITDNREVEDRIGEVDVSPLSSYEVAVEPF